LHPLQSGVVSQLAVESTGGQQSRGAEVSGHETGGEPTDWESWSQSWKHHHLLGLELHSAEEIQSILDLAERFAEASQEGRNRLTLLRGFTVANLFFENSTRTRNSFSLAAKRLGADTVEFSSAGSSTSKGETFIDTAKTIEAMGVDAVVVRHATPGTPHLLAKHLSCSVLNAGDGPHEHPTQGLLDILTIRQHRGSLKGLTVGLIGDIEHSRTARSNIWGLQKLGAHVIVCGPATLVSRRWEQLGVETSHRLDDILPRCDVLNLLRIQFERQTMRPFPSVHEYGLLYAMTKERLARSKPDVLILAPGPINRGVELTSEVADGHHSVILHQVANGISIRMAVLWLLLGRRVASESLARG
jgi:aspartate carbamoyltransferase catalytic subunit